MAYRDEINIKNRKKLNILLEELPYFCSELFAGRELRLSESSMLSYASDLKKFFNYLLDAKEGFEGLQMADISLEHLAQVDVSDIAWYIRICKEDGNQETSIERRISSISMMYEYFVKQQKLSNNPVDGIDRIKPKKKKIIRLENDEKKKFLDAAQSGYGLTSGQKKWHDINGVRDYAIMRLFLSTGIRISELVGINMQDINLDRCIASVIRKGGKYEEVYFSDSTKEALESYLLIRKQYKPPDSEKALFLSNRGRRIGVRTVELMVKKYASVSLPGKSDKITPHKLRSTFATDFYRATGDIYATADAMGHENIQTTTIYADKKEGLGKLRNVTE